MVILAGGGLSATSTGLFFDFSDSAPDAVTFVVDHGSFWLLNSVGVNSAGLLQERMGWLDAVDDTTQLAFVAHTTLESIGTVTVPEPATLGLLGLGLAGIGIGFARRKRKS